MRKLHLLGVLLAAACGATDDDSDTAELAHELAPAGYQLVSGETALNTSGQKQLTVSCPKAMVALGAGWGVLDGTNANLPGQATYFAPHYAGTSWLTNARFVGGWSTPWKLKVTVVCARRPAGYEVVFSQSDINNLSDKQVNASCALGSVALGAGWEVLDPTSAILDGEATYSMAAYDASSWLVNARSESAGNWFLRTRLICASAAAFPAFEVATQTSALDTLSMKQVIGSCPAGKVVTSSGWGALDATDAFLRGAPRHSLPGWAATTWATNATVAGGVSWKLRVRTLCL